MNIINFFKSFIWNDEMKDLANLIFLIIDLIITGIIYELHVRGVLSVYNMGWLDFSGYNFLELLISFTLLVVSKRVIEKLLLFFSRIFKNGMRNDINKLSEAHNIPIEDILFAKDDINEINTKSMNFFRYVISIFFNNSDKIVIGFYLVSNENGISFLNKFSISVLSLLFVLSYSFWDISYFIIILSVSLAILFVVNVFLMIIMEYRDIFISVFGIDKLNQIK